MRKVNIFGGDGTGHGEKIFHMIMCLILNAYLNRSV